MRYIPTKYKARYGINEILIDKYYVRNHIKYYGINSFKEKISNITKVPFNMIHIEDGYNGYFIFGF